MENNNLELSRCMRVAGNTVVLPSDVKLETENKSAASEDKTPHTEQPFPQIYTDLCTDSQKEAHDR